MVTPYPALLYPISEALPPRHAAVNRSADPSFRSLPLRRGVGSSLAGVESDQVCELLYVYVPVYSLNRFDGFFFSFCTLSATRDSRFIISTNGPPTLLHAFASSHLFSCRFMLRCAGFLARTVDVLRGDSASRPWVHLGQLRPFSLCASGAPRRQHRYGPG